MAREQAVRAALADAGRAGRAVAEGVRAVVARLRGDRRGGIRRAATATTRCGRPAQLSLDAFARFGQAQRPATPACGCCSGSVAAYPDQQAREAGAGSSSRAATPSQPAAPRHATAAAASAAPPRRRRPRRRATAPRARVAATAAAPSTPIAHDQGHPPRPCCPTPCAITIELDGEVPFHDERIPDPARVFLDLPGDARRRRRSSIRRCASTATPTSCGRSASAGIRTTRRASCSTPPASRATASIRSTTRTGW